MKGRHTSQIRRHSVSLSALAAFGATALTVALAGQASAAPLVASSPYLAGYIATPGAGVASVSATFKVPTINCSDGNGYTQEWGIDVSSDTIFSAVAGICNGAGAATYAYIVLANDDEVIEPGASPGDTVVTSGFETGTTTEADIHDLTNGTRYRENGSPVSALASVDIGGFNEGATPPFTTTAFSKCQVNGQYLADESPVQYNQKSGHVTLVTSSRIARPGDGFKLTFKNEI
jgi:hypothetical protein